MSTNVIDITARLASAKPQCGCTRHMFQAVMGRAQSQLDQSPLLLPRDVLESVIADIGRTLESVLTPEAGVRP